MNMKIYKIIFLMAATSVVVPHSNSQVQDSTSNASPEETTMLMLPIIYYTPETKIALGATGVYFFSLESEPANSNLSTIRAEVVGTEMHQFHMEINPEICFPNNSYKMTLSAGTKKYPAHFYKLGNFTRTETDELYTPQISWGNVKVQNHLAAAWHMGVYGSFEQWTMQYYSDNGALARNEIPGSAGGAIVGAGLFIAWDSRNHPQFPISGNYAEISASSFNDVLGSDYEFLRYRFDLRRYFSLSSCQTVAAQAVMQLQSGNVPFQSMSTYGGKDLLRGYAEGRNREKNGFAAQVEYRFVPVFWNLGFSLFAGIGEVTSTASSFAASSLRPSAGFGIRYLFLEKEKINLRFDFGWGHNSSGFYITAGEAF